MTRNQVLLLVALSGFMLSGSQPPAPGTPAVSAAPPEQHERIVARIAGLNPHLTPGQLDRIEAAIDRYSEKYGLDPVLVAAVIEVESSGKPWARSPAGALGLMQVMPHMIRPMGMAGNPSTVEANVEAGCAILASNIRRLGEEDGISAYFWGGNIKGPGYLNKVKAARERLRAELEA
ncbi:MAG: transglycosylase SLT domain-containing protein [Deltaproteobacteria bacterium]|nr:transglycosylase SLT domain-containing protein [Deltaproteobacteria bacterium]